MRTALSPLAAYELWADSYPPRPHNPLMEAEQAVVSRLLDQSSANCALDVGTGSGRYLPLLQARAHRVVGVDVSMAMLARNRGPWRVNGDACRLPFRSGAFGLVNASLTVGDIADLAGWMREISRVMRPGARFVYSDFHPSWTERGWERTFQAADGAKHVVSFVPHAIDAHLAAIEAAGLRVLAIREPRLIVGGVSVPVVVVFHAAKLRGAVR
jgi:malonyl-CoA O-methyltransferase